MVCSECYIPTAKRELLERALEMLEPGQRTQVAEIGRLLSATFHYETLDELENLKDLYRPLDPTEPPAPNADVDGFLREFERVLKMANYLELPPQSVLEHAGKSTLADLKVKTDAAGVGRIRFFHRGVRKEKVVRRRFWGLRKQNLDVDVLNDILIIIELQKDAVAAKALEKIRRGARPGALLLKHFGDVPRPELISLHPGASPAMKRHDQLMLGVPALAGGLPLLTQLLPALAVIFAVLGAYLGFEHGELTDDALKRALASLSLFVGLGTFVMRQRLKFDRQRLFYQKKLAETVYFHTVANNMGVIAGLVSEAEDQDWKEAFLAYALLLRQGPVDKAGLDRMIEDFLASSFGLKLDFEIGDALSKLERLGLVSPAMDGKLTAVAPTDAFARLDAAWDGYFRPETGEARRA